MSIQNPFQDGESRSAALLNSIASAHLLTGILSGGELSAGVGDWEVEYDATEYMIGGNRHSLASGSVTHSEANDTLRIDLVVFDDAENAQVIEGDPADAPDNGEEKPIAEDIPSNATLAGIVLVRGDANDIQPADILNDYETRLERDDIIGTEELREDSVGSAQLIDDAVGTDAIDLSISPTWTGEHTFGSVTIESLGIDGNTHIPIAGASPKGDTDDTSSTSYTTIVDLAGTPIDVSEVPTEATLYGLFQVRGSADNGETMHVRPRIYSPTENSSAALDELELTFDDNLSTESSGWTEITTTLTNTLYRPRDIQAKVSGGTSGPDSRLTLLFAWRFD